MSKDISRLIQQQSSKKKDVRAFEKERMDILRATVRSTTSDDNSGTANSLTRIITFEISGQIVTETGKLAFTNKSGSAMTIIGVHARVNTAPTGTAIEVDINKNGTSILPAALSIAAGDTSAYTATISVASFAADEYLTMDIDQAGALGSGLDLVVEVVATQDAIVANVTNADTLDGVDSTGFALAAHTHTYASPLTVEETDGTPSVATVTKIKVTNGTLTDNGAGVVTIATGGGGSLTIEEADGTPSVAVSKLIVPNGSLADNGGGQGTLTFGGGTDSAAIHDNVDGEIHAITEETAPAADDEIIIEKASASYAKRRVKVSNLQSGSITCPTVVQTKVSDTQATSVTLDSAPTNGNVLILYSNSTTGQISNVACTNVTWTQLATFASGGGSYYALWVGIIGASAGTNVSCTKPGTYNTFCVIEVDATLTPTLGEYSFQNTSQFKYIQDISKGDFVVAGISVDNTTLDCNVTPIMTKLDGANTGTDAIALVVMTSPGDLITVGYAYTGAGAAILAALS